MKDRARRLMGCMGGIDDELVMEASVVRLRRSHWGTWAALAACMVLVITLPMTLGRSEAKPEDETPGLEDPAEYQVLYENATPVYRDVADENIMGLTLGMTGDDIRLILGEPKSVSNSGPITFPDGSTRVCWFYEDLKLDLVDVGEGWFLNHIMASNTGWTLSTGIGIGSTEEEVNAAYPDAQTHESEAIHDDKMIRQKACYVDEGLELFLVAGEVKYVLLGPLVQEPSDEEWEQTASLPYDLVSGEITIYEMGAEPVTAVDRAAKRISTILTISEPEEGEAPDFESPASWLDLHNGTVLERLDEDWVMVFTCEGDFDPAVTGKMTHHLTGRFPGLDDAVAQALADPDAGWE